MVENAPYGSWKSPITSDVLVAETRGLGEITLDGQAVYWVESRPTEAGRSVIVKLSPREAVIDVTPRGFNVRSRVHEYGGGAYLISEGVVYFSNFTDQRLYRQRPDEPPRAITPEGGWRYADGVMDQVRSRIICVLEDHNHTGMGGQPENSIATVDVTEEGEPRVLVSGNDFYASPRLSPDGAHLAWLTWNHPNMPWDGTELWVARVQADGSLGTGQRVAGGMAESIFQPEWSPDGVLHFVSDRSGWWNLYRWRATDGIVEPLCEMEAEFGLPQWVFGMSTYAFASAGKIVCAYAREGTWHLASLDAETLQLTPIETGFTSIHGLRAIPGTAAFVGGSPTGASGVVRLDLRSQQVDVLRRSSRVEIAPGFLAAPEPLDYPTTGGERAHALFYRPKNEDFSAPAGERPPLMVISHGGPTGATDSALRLATQYWTSRGVAVLDVNYRGSTGYGRAYREQLKGQWGVVDVDDCANGARYLEEQGLVDGERLIIRGGSAGGFTTLCALAFRDLFHAGASYYGVSDLEALARDTHKFESRYLDGLVGPYPEQKQIYRERSPIHHVVGLSCPVIFFQGLEDRVVPPNQTELMVAALRSSGLPVAYLAFEGEQHGFRRAENIKRALDAELYFYSRVFGFDLADPVDPVEIANL
jgi:dipeptidyl aminopeptidase/acylaminoacyl peptidase